MIAINSAIDERQWCQRTVFVFSVEACRCSERVLHGSVIVTFRFQCISRSSLGTFQSSLALMHAHMCTHCGYWALSAVELQRRARARRMAGVGCHQGVRLYHHHTCTSHDAPPLCVLYTSVHATTSMRTRHELFALHAMPLPRCCALEQISLSPSSICM